MFYCLAKEIYVTCYVYTWVTIISVVRVRRDVYEKLKKLKVKVGARSIAELISILVEIAESELDKFHGDPKVFLKTLKYAGEAGKYDSERVDELLHGE